MSVEEEVMRIQKKLTKMTSGDGSVCFYYYQTPFIFFFLDIYKYCSKPTVFVSKQILAILKSLFCG